MADPVIAFELETDASVEFIAERDGSLYVGIDRPWAGDSERGFGEYLSATLSREQAADLMRWLQARFAQKKSAGQG